MFLQSVSGFASSKLCKYFLLSLFMTVGLCAMAATGPKWRDMTIAGLPAMPKETEDDTWRIGGDAATSRGSF